MTLIEKIISVRPKLSISDFSLLEGTIIIQNDSDGKGDYIKEWNHPTETQPTEEELSE